MKRNDRTRSDVAATDPALASPRMRGGLIAALLALVIGAILRLMFPEDIEFKQDEFGYLRDSLDFKLRGGWPWIGPNSSMEMPSPGMGLGAVYLLLRLSNAATAPELARAVAVSSIVAIAALIAFAVVCTRGRSRDLWLWGAALWAVNPVAIVLERKIWPVSVLPIFTVALIAAWWYRVTRTGALLWGLAGALMGQVHIGAAIFALAIAAWTAIRDGRTVRWGYWFAGSIVGSLPALPWVMAFMSSGASGEGAWRWRFPIATFYTRWVTAPFGIANNYGLSNESMREFVTEPSAGGRQTYVVGFVIITLALIALIAAARALRTLHGATFTWRGLLVGHDAEGMLIRATLIGYGGIITLLTISGPGSHRHYLIVAFPIMMLWAVKLVRIGDGLPTRRFGTLLLGLSCAGQAIVSATLLAYIHGVQLPGGDYGPTWRIQRDICAPSDVGSADCRHTLGHQLKPP